MDKKYLNQSNLYNKSGRCRPGVISSTLPTKREKNNPADKDSENRRQVVDEIEKLMETGITLEEACKSLVEKYKDKFRYFPETSLTQIFAGWYNGRIKDRNRIAEDRIW